MQTILLFEEFTNKGYTMYSGISETAWETIWKDKNLTEQYTNVTDDYDTALEFAYDWKTGEYSDVVVKISNIPLDAFVACRGDDYEDDEDVVDMENLSNEEKINCVNNYSMFLLDLFPYKDQITVSLSYGF